MFHDTPKNVCSMLNFSYICTVKRLMGNRISRTATILTASHPGILTGKREIQVWQPFK